MIGLVNRDSTIFINLKIKIISRNSQNKWQPNVLLHWKITEKFSIKEN